jgi:hypothetical protein
MEVQEGSKGKSTATLNAIILQATFNKSSLPMIFRLLQQYTKKRNSLDSDGKRPNIPAQSTGRSTLDFVYRHPRILKWSKENTAEKYSLLVGGIDWMI